MNSPRLFLLLALTLASVLPAQADTTVGTPINSLPAFLGRPGKYRLTKGFNFTADENAIVITARDVVLDLNGFTINGPEDASESSVCIRITGQNAIVRNGTIRRFHTGVTDEGNDATGTLLEDLQFVNQGAIGVRLGSGESLLRRLRVRGTGTGSEGTSADRGEFISGLFLNGSATIEHCLIQRLGSQSRLGISVAGMRLSSGASYVVRDCDILNILGTGIVYGGDVSGILESVRIRTAAVGLNVNGGEAPLLRDSTFRDTTVTTSGPVDDGGRNQLTAN